MNPWICPRCGIVWAGWVAKCTCVSFMYLGASTIWSYSVCKHCGAMVLAGSVHQCPRRESMTEPLDIDSL